MFSFIIEFNSFLIMPCDCISLIRFLNVFKNELTSVVNIAYFEDKKLTKLKFEGVNGMFSLRSIYLRQNPTLVLIKSLT